jgi:hypothetical protein
MYRPLWALVVLFLASISASAQITMVHVTTCGPQSFPTMPCTIPTSGAGNLIVVGIQLGGGVNTNTTISGVTGSAGNVYTEGAARSYDTGPRLWATSGMPRIHIRWHYHHNHAKRHHFAGLCRNLGVLRSRP